MDTFEMDELSSRKGKKVIFYLEKGSRIRRRSGLGFYLRMFRTLKGMSSRLYIRD